MSKLYSLKVNRGYKQGDDTQSRWVQIGTMTKNNGAGHTAHLDVLPLIDPATGRPEKFQVFPIEPKKEVANEG